MSSVSSTLLGLAAIAGYGLVVQGITRALDARRGGVKQKGDYFYINRVSNAIFLVGIVVYGAWQFFTRGLTKIELYAILGVAIALVLIGVPALLRRRRD